MRQLSFAFLQFRRHTTELPAGIAASIEASRPVTLHKIEPAKNMARFYALEMEQDLFGRHVLVRRWGRIGTAGKIRLDEHTGEGEAWAALQRLQMAKRRKGYQGVERP
jgi:predicted DNA-binding WGR domain protein